MSDEITTREQEILKYGEMLHTFMETTAQPRTFFEISHFVVGQHSTPQYQWKQLIDSLKGHLFNIRRYELQVMKLQKEIEDLGVDVTKNYFDIELKKVDLEELNLQRLGNVREAEVYMTLLQQFPENGYSWEEIEKAEEERWLNKFSGDAYNSQRGTLPVGLLEALNNVQDLLAKYIDDPRALYLATMQGSRGETIKGIADEVRKNLPTPVTPKISEG